jgi:hypothetical protein
MTIVGKAFWINHLLFDDHRYDIKKIQNEKGRDISGPAFS